MNISKLFTSLYERIMHFEQRTKFRDERKNLIAHAHGRVLEIGSGTGANFPYYADVQSVDGIEPNQFMIERSKSNLKRANVPITVHQQTVENLSFPENTFDSVVSTLVFCTVDDPEVALNNMLRVTKQNGTLLFLEHVRMDQACLGKTQDILNPLWKRIAGGCHLNRQTLDFIEQSPLKIHEVKSLYRGLVVKIICKYDGSFLMR